MIFTKNKEGVRAIRAIKYQKSGLKNILAQAHLWRKIEYSRQKMTQQV